MCADMNIRTYTATRYVTPLVEGGSLPAVVDTEDGDLFVMKFRGAGQGPKTLVAELIAGQIGQVLGLLVPELAFVMLDEALGPSEPNQEISDLLRASVGLNLGLRYLPHSFAYNALLQPRPSPDLASTIVWFDAYVTNVDRTPRNTNILVWQRRLWLIDHGAALYFHHDWRDYMERSRSPFPRIKDHVLLPFAAALPQAAESCIARLSPEKIYEIVDRVPDEWLDGGPFRSPAEHREAYVAYLLGRLEASSIFVGEAVDARALLI